MRNKRAATSAESIAVFSVIVAVCIACLSWIVSSSAPRETLPKFSQVDRYIQPNHSPRSVSRITINKSQFYNWPFIYSYVDLMCDPPGSNIIIIHAGRSYALNGRAMGNAEYSGYLNVSSIMISGDDDLHATVQTIIGEGLKLCK